jgi:gluconate 2-dehydrogenase gamma chain
MAGQSIERRDALRMIGMASAAGAFPGFARWCFAFAPQRVDKPARYEPRFFTPGEYAIVERAADLIIPSDGTPGAREAGVAEFIDFMVGSDTSLQYRFRYGLLWLDTLSRSRHQGRGFTAISPAEQTALLEPLAYTAKHQPGQEDGRAFFRLLRDYTVMGFYTTRIGWQELDVPGLRMYSASPECPHKDDPEHARLRQ